MAHEAAYEGHSEEQQLTEPSPFARHWARHSIGVIWTEEEAEAQRGCDSMQGHTSGKRQSGLLNPEHMLPPTWPQLGPAGPGPMAAPRQSRGLRHPCTGYPRSPQFTGLTLVPDHQLTGRCQGPPWQGCPPAADEATGLFLHSPVCLGNDGTPTTPSQPLF